MPSVREQYEKWVYPLPSTDLDRDYKEGYFDLSDPSLFRRKIWPRAVEPDKPRILIAGCGTTQAARIAFRNSECEVVGVDISQTSLDHEAVLKEQHSLENLHLHCLSILDIEALDAQFDLIISTGVLHHLPDPGAGLRKLKSVLGPHGVLSLMVYGRYPRVGVYMMQEAFRLLGVEQTPEGVALVRETLNALPAWHHVKAFARTAEDMTYDAGVVDLLLHAQDRAFTVPELMRLIRDGGLCFQDWLDRLEYSITAHIDQALPIFPRAAQLPLEEQWQLVELLTQALDRHYCLLCHPERAAQEYAIDFSAMEPRGAWLTYTPHLRWPMDVRNAQGGWQSYAPNVRPSIEALLPAGPRHGTVTFRRYKHVFTLGGREATMFALVTGARTIEQIVVESPREAGSVEEIQSAAFALFARMHEWDHVLYAI